MRCLVDRGFGIGPARRCWHCHWRLNGNPVDNLSRPLGMLSDVQSAVLLSQSIDKATQLDNPRKRSDVHVGERVRGF